MTQDDYQALSTLMIFAFGVFLWILKGIFNRICEKYKIREKK